MPGVSQETATQEGDGRIVLSPIAGAAEAAGSAASGGTAAVLGTNITRTLELSLRLAVQARVERADFIFPHVSLERARHYYRSVGASKAVFGTVRRAEEDGFTVAAELWTMDAPEHTQRREYRVESVLAVFDVADQIALEIASAVVGRELSFGAVRIENTDWLDDFGIYVDGNLVDRNATEIQVVSGSREVIVARPGRLGDEPVERFEVNVPPGESVTVALQPPEEPDEPEALEERGGASAADEAGGGAERVPTGRLVIASLPPGAEVLLDDRTIGTTPLNRFGVPEGRYELVVRRPYFRPVTRVVDVAADRANEISVDLEVDPDHPDVAAVLVDPGRSTIMGLGMTVLQAAAGASTPAALLGRGTAHPMLNADVFLKAGIVRPTHWLSATSTEAAVVTAAGVVMSSVFVVGQMMTPVIEAQTNQTAARTGYIMTMVGGFGAIGVQLYDLSFGPGAARRRNAATIEEIDATGRIAERTLYDAAGFSVEAGGAALVRLGYSYGFLEPYLYAHGSLGATLTGWEPFAVGGSVLLRVEGYPFSTQTGNARPYLGPVATLDVSGHGWGMSAGYDFGLVVMTRFGRIFAGSRSLWGLRSGGSSLSFYAGVGL